MHESARAATGFGRSLLRLIGELDLRVERYRTRRTLMDLSDHQLRDIGVTREEAWREASRPFWG
ncbi:MAG: DUF1127 domain-containing protein [Rhizobiaceae bacterium]|nr:DUF1127 domain-containing protein [Rhizobiaceae bacterium]MCV0408851.1 DUF1127 domain-containing protein [Rhizobiaceae bacterium]